MTNWQSLPAKDVGSVGKLPTKENTQTYVRHVGQFPSKRFTEYMESVIPGKANSMMTWLLQLTPTEKWFYLGEEHVVTETVSTHNI